MSIETLKNLINSLLNNKNMKMFIITITSVLAGYTLQRVPEWLNNLFNDSNLLKFIILFLILCTIYHPLTDEDIYYIIIISFFILFLFELFRTK